MVFWYEPLPGPVKRGWVDASHAELPFIEETKKIIKDYANTSTLKVELEKLGWKYQRLSSFLASFLRQQKLVFLTPRNTDVEPGLKLEVVMGRTTVSHYYLMRWMEVGPQGEQGPPGVS